MTIKKFEFNGGYVKFVLNKALSKSILNSLLHQKPKAMKRTKVLADVMIAIMIILLLIMFLEFLATSDIYNEYVSRRIIQHYSPESVNALPGFSANVPEWKMFNVSFVSRTILIITSLVLSISISQRNKEEEEAV